VVTNAAERRHLERRRHEVAATRPYGG
jgi:hypothetical protein